MPSRKGTPTVITTHLPADFQGDVKSDARLDSPLFPPPPSVSKNPAFGLKGCSTQTPYGKPTHPQWSWVWTHRCFSCSQMRFSISAVVETAKTAFHCKSALLQDCWKALKGTRTTHPAPSAIPPMTERLRRPRRARVQR